MKDYWVNDISLNLDNFIILNNILNKYYLEDNK